MFNQLKIYYNGTSYIAKALDNIFVILDEKNN